MNQQINYRFNIRVFQGDEPYLGKGRIQLLERIIEYGSIAQAARSMDMSYRKAWQLVKDMNQMAPAPLVEKQSGGKAGGGAIVTPHGQAAIQKYHTLLQKLEDFLAITHQEIDWNLT